MDCLRRGEDEAPALIMQDRPHETLGQATNRHSQEATFILIVKRSHIPKGEFAPCHWVF
jgi:hypothetical protein